MQLRIRLRKETKTAKLIDDGDLMSAFTFNSALRARYNFQYATVDNFKVTVNRINNMPKSYKFNAVICIARTEEEQTTLRLKIAEAVRDSAYADIIFIDATSNIMGADRFEQWISVAAQTEYWRPKDPVLPTINKQMLNVLLQTGRMILREENSQFTLGLTLKKMLPV